MNSEELPILLSVVCADVFKDIDGGPRHSHGLLFIVVDDEDRCTYVVVASCSYYWSYLPPFPTCAVSSPQRPPRARRHTCTPADSPRALRIHGARSAPASPGCGLQSILTEAWRVSSCMVADARLQSTPLLLKSPAPPPTPPFLFGAPSVPQRSARLLRISPRPTAAVIHHARCHPCGLRSLGPPVHAAFANERT